MAWNAQKDRVNKLLTIRFAEETGQDLRAFYSCDTWAEYKSTSDNKKKRRCWKKVKHKPTSTNITEEDQQML